MKTVKDVFAAYQQGLAGIYNSYETEAITSIVLIDLLNLNKAKLKAFPETKITYEQLHRLNNILSELKKGRPVQYILGHTEFYGLSFKVNPSVLIPRPETEELVQWIIDIVNKLAVPVKNVLDIGTGSGCIAIILKKYLLNIELFAIDISDDALYIAKTNAELNQVAINFIKDDILNFSCNTELSDFDIIVSNPPYVTSADKKNMHHNVTDFEPHTALFVPQNEPLLFYNAIADFAKERLTDNGLLFFEINESYGTQIVELLRNKSFHKIELRQDMYGRDRMIKAEISK